MGSVMSQVKLPCIAAAGSLSQALNTMSGARRSACAIVPEARGRRPVVVSLDEVIHGMNTLGDVTLVDLLSSPGNAGGGTASGVKSSGMKSRRGRRMAAGKIGGALAFRAFAPGGTAALVNMTRIAASYAMGASIVCLCPDNHAFRLSQVKIRGRCNIDGKPLTCG